MLVTITGINSQEKTSKKGKPYTSVGILTEENGDKWINGFGPVEWKKGDKVELMIEETEYGLQFKVPNATDSLAKRVTGLEKQTKWLFGEYTKLAKKLGIVGSSGGELPAIEKKEQKSFDNVDFSQQSEEIPF